VLGSAYWQNLQCIFLMRVHVPAVLIERAGTTQRLDGGKEASATGRSGSGRHCKAALG
jgi:hypothetical protein